VKRLCIIIPAFNEQLGIGKSIDSCLAAGLAAEDIYILDDGSKDRTVRTSNLRHVNVLAEPNIGKEANIKRGIAHYNLFDRYEYMTILDADSYVDPDYPAAIERCVKRYPAAVAISGAVRSQRGSWLTAYRAVETFLSTNVYREAQHLLGVITVAPGCASTYQCKAFRELDFDGGTLVEDMDWTVQFHRRGQLVVQAMDAIIYTQDPKTITGLFHQVQRWHRGTFQVVRLRKLCHCFWHPTMDITAIDMEFLIIIGEALFFGMGLLLLPLWFYLWPMKTLYALLADQAVMFAFVLLTARRDKRLDVIYAFPLFLIPRVVSYCSFLLAFIRERRPQKVAWYSPERW
jgi:cellulose synthase/poly-beta-1,6-N-acetylglucosamine synthase-like glycosyltransferase